MTLSLIMIALLGGIIGHLLRRWTPHLMGLKDTRLPFRYPWVELIGALGFWLIAWHRGLELAQWKWLLFGSLLLLIATVDALTKYIPTLVCYLGAAAGLILNALFPDDILDLFAQYRLLDLVGLAVFKQHLAGAVLALAGGLMGFCQIEFIRRVFKPLVRIEVMGFGDVLLMMMIGAFIGPQAVLFALLPACLIGIVIGLVRLVLYGVHHSAFGPALALGALAILLQGGTMLSGMRAFHALLYDLPPMVLLFFSLFLIVVLLVLVARLKRKGAVYERMLEEDYEKIDQQMK